jgi:hypothetical protein
MYETVLAGIYQTNKPYIDALIYSKRWITNKKGTVKNSSLFV